MTPKCVRRVIDLQEHSPEFCDLSVEQLLYAAIIGTGLEDVKWVLETTDWTEHCPNVEEK